MLESSAKDSWQKKSIIAPRSSSEEEENLLKEVENSVSETPDEEEDIVSETDENPSMKSGVYALIKFVTKVLLNITEERFCLS